MQFDRGNGDARNRYFGAVALALLSFTGCSQQAETDEKKPVSPPPTNTTTDARVPKQEAPFQIRAELIPSPDTQLIRPQVPGFDQLTLREKKLAYYLYEAALSGQDIFYDQLDPHGLTIRRTVENIYRTFKGDRATNDWKAFESYCGHFWFHSGNHFRDSSDKFIPDCSAEYFEQIARDSDPTKFPLREGESLEGLLTRIRPIVFDPTVSPKLVATGDGDLVINSSVNFYKGVSQQEVTDFYNNLPGDPLIPYGLNSRLVKGEDGVIREQVYKTDGLYGPAIKEMISWLEKAVEVADNPRQAFALEKLIVALDSGDLQAYNEYCEAWVQGGSFKIDMIVGFWEKYCDPLGRKATFEGKILLQDPQGSDMVRKLAENALWFELNAPIADEHRNPQVRGIVANIVSVMVASGHAGPRIAIGQNLPGTMIKDVVGTKSYVYRNIINGLDLGWRSNLGAEFAPSPDDIVRSARYGGQAETAMTVLHEVAGHGSGKARDGVANPDRILGQYYSCLEELRAEVYALYWLPEPKLVEIGFFPDSETATEIARIGYTNFITNAAITQLMRLAPGKDLAQDHMRMRHAIASWAYERGKDDNAIEFFEREGKTYVRVNDHNKLRGIFGELLREVQRIKSEGDFQAARDLIERHGVRVDQELADQVRKRVKSLHIAAKAGFVQPELTPLVDGDGDIVDVKLGVPESFFEQMMRFGERYSTLPAEN